VLLLQASSSTYLGEATAHVSGAAAQQTHGYLLIAVVICKNDPGLLLPNVSCCHTHKMTPATLLEFFWSPIKQISCTKTCKAKEQQALGW
jgi:hypothetical protein